METEERGATAGSYSLGSQQSRGMASTEDRDIGEELQALLPEERAEDFETRWGEIQAKFVDDPRRSLERASQLVDVVMKQLTQGFAEERANLERQWAQGGDVSTEELRVALQRYRSFFQRLVATRTPTER